MSAPRRAESATLFDPPPRDVPLADDAVLLGGFALPVADALHEAITDVARAAPFRHMVIPGGRQMSVAMTNCGELGWIADRRGYRYVARDPDSGAPWPELPAVVVALASRAASRAGFAGFVPNACLVNRYVPGARLSLHQDRDEADLDAPIVSVSLGLPATFVFGGPERADRTRRVTLVHGDVAVWGGRSRLAFHGVLPLPDGAHPLGRLRYNLTLRRAASVGRVDAPR